MHTLSLTSFFFFSLEIVDKKVKPPHSHLFTFRTPEEADEWRVVLRGTIERHSTRVATARSEKFGYLKKKGKRRFLVTLHPISNTHARMHARTHARTHACTHARMNALKQAFKHI